MRLLSRLVRPLIALAGAHPGLDAALRRMVTRVPLLARIARRSMAQARMDQYRLGVLPVYADDAQLPAASLMVLQDLRQAIGERR